MKDYKIDLSMYTGEVRAVISKAIQEKAFSLGIFWRRDSKNIEHTDKSYLFIVDDMLYYGNSHFSSHESIQITVEDFLVLVKEPDFKPFDKVLVRNSPDASWHIDFFESMIDSQYSCMHRIWKQCVLYEGNENLLEGATE